MRLRIRRLGVRILPYALVQSVTSTAVSAPIRIWPCTLVSFPRAATGPAISARSASSPAICLPATVRMPAPGPTRANTASTSPAFSASWNAIGNCSGAVMVENLPCLKADRRQKSSKFGRIQISFLTSLISAGLPPRIAESLLPLGREQVVQGQSTQGLRLADSSK